MRSSEESYFSRLDHLRFVAAVLALFWHIYRNRRMRRPRPIDFSVAAI